MAQVSESKRAKLEAFIREHAERTGQVLILREDGTVAVAPAGMTPDRIGREV